MSLKAATYTLWNRRQCRQLCRVRGKKARGGLGEERVVVGCESCKNEESRQIATNPKLVHNARMNDWLEWNGSNMRAIIMHAHMHTHKCSWGVT